MTSWVVVTKCGCRRLLKEANESFFLLHQKVLTKAGLSERTDHIQILLPPQFPTVVSTTSRLISRAAAARAVVTHCRKDLYVSLGKSVHVPQGEVSHPNIYTQYMISVIPTL